MMTTSKICCI